MHADLTNDLVIQGDIHFNRKTHEYFHVPTRKKLMSVSQIIKIVYAKKSWDGVDPAVVENARYRGMAVDDYVAEYIRTGRVEVEESEDWPDLELRVVTAIDLLEKHYGNRRKIEAQKIVYDAELGIAGTADIVIDDEEVVDLKSTWGPEVDWMLQIGGYSWLGKFLRTAIIHVSPKYYKKENVSGRLLRYNTQTANHWWFSAMSWWLKSKELENGFKKKEGISA